MTITSIGFSLFPLTCVNTLISSFFTCQTVMHSDSLGKTLRRSPYTKVKHVIQISLPIVSGECKKREWCIWQRQASVYTHTYGRGEGVTPFPLDIIDSCKCFKLIAICHLTSQCFWPVFPWFYSEWKTCWCHNSSDCHWPLPGWAQ